MASALAALFVALFLAQLAIETALSLLNYRHVALGRGHPGGGDPDQVARSRAYALARTRLGVVHALWSAAVTLAVLSSGALPWLDRALASVGLAGAQRFVAFLAILAAVLAASSLPFGIYGTFVVEQRFGFNRTTPALWLRDRLKGLAVSAALGVPLLYATYAFMAFTGSAWWLWVFAFFTAFQIGMLWVYPALIAPLFNRFVPLPDGPLRTRLEGLAREAGFRTRGLFVMDASRRSGHSNAYFIGLFRPRIVLFDTLVQEMTIEEAAAVLAHEIGHYQRRHVHKRLAAGLVGLLVTLFILARLLAWPPIFQVAGFDGPSFHAALALAGLCSGAFTFVLDPVSAWISRRHEYEADRFAVRLTGRGDALRAALARLHGQNLSVPCPHPWHSAWHDSHPTLLQRAAAIEREEALLPGGAVAAPDPA